MLDDPFSPLTFIAGPAILTNACAIMQNGATTRYNLAVTQWRDFTASLAARDGRMTSQYVAPLAAMALAERRVRLQLRGLGLLNAAVALFGATTILGLGGAFLVRAHLMPAAPVTFVMTVAGGGALLLLLAATTLFFLESGCGRGLMDLHRGASVEVRPTRKSWSARRHAY